jgi:hypothetical protein
MGSEPFYAVGQCGYRGYQSLTDSDDQGSTSCEAPLKRIFNKDIAYKGL